MNPSNIISDSKSNLQKTMCRCTDYYDSHSNDQNLLKIKAFFVRFSNFHSCTDPLSDSLTLLFPPRINEAARLEVSGSSIRSSSAAYVTLHRVVNVNRKDGEAVYGSREPVRAGDGIRFEVYSREEKLLKGVFRREEADEWRIECKCALERRDGEMVKEGFADVCVAAEGDVAMGERVEMVVRKCRKNKKVGFCQLEDIPEEREGESESDGGCCCCCCGETDGGDGGGDGGGGPEMDMEVAGGSWAFDVGFWVMCFGVGYVVSKASAKSLRRMRIF